MDDEKGWLRESWRTGVVLALLLGLAFFLRVYFVWNLFYPAGFFSFKGDYSGGSDPFYWERAMFYTLQTGKEISRDLAMNYPIGFPDVRPPLFAWFNVLTGYLLAPVLGGARDASVFMLNMNAAILGTLTLIPTYLLGKEAFGKRVGVIATLLLAISAAALQRSHATIGVHDAWTLFFVVCAFYFYLRALKTLNRGRWVENWFQPSSVAQGLRAFFRGNEKSVLYGALAGMSVAVTALSWQGWAYVPVILVLVYVVEIMLDRIRNQDVLGVTVLFALIFATPLLVSFPWYYVRGLIHVWWDVPFYLFAVALVLGIVFSMTRDYPWTLVIPATFIAGGVGLVIGFAVNPSLLLAFVSGAGYFVKNKVYQTIAEAQEPGMSELVLSFGWFTFYLGLGAIAIMIWQTPRRNNPAFTMLVFWTLGSLFMALSAARFIFNAAPVFAVATGYAIDLILIRMDFAGMRRTYRSLAEGNRRNALRKSIKMRHVLTILFIAFLILLPNTWFAVDAAIPFELKTTYDQQVNALLPSFLQAPGYAQAVQNRGTFYFGAFGYSLPTSTDYFPATYAWLDTQDLGVPLEQRPSVMAWWDYGFEIAERGGHPVVADPFQNGYAIAGQFILSQNESAAISLMTIRLVEGDYWLHPGSLSPAVNDTLNQFGVPGEVFRYAFRYPASLAPVILANPNLYGPWDSNIQPSNAAYIYLSVFMLQRLSGDRLVQLYDAIRGATGWSIGYFMVDTRLFPISAQNTGIFYAPAKLSDHRVTSLTSGQVMPQDFFQLFADTSQGTHLPVQILPPTATITSETIEYQPMFYNSMFYRAYVGYSPTDLGQASDKGIPGFDQALSGIAPMPAWNLTHFRVVYRTAYYNPFPDASNHTGAWQAVNYDQAIQLQKQINAGVIKGTVDLSTQATVSNGAIVLAYYDGAWVNGTVTVAGKPLPDAFVTATDELGTPHYITRTDAQGRYSVLVPFGNVSLTVSDGNLTMRTLTGSQVLSQTTFPVTVNQAMRVDEDLNGDGIPDWLMTKDFALPSVTVQGVAYFDVNKDNVRGAGDLPVADASLTLTNSQYTYAVQATTDANGAYTAAGLLPGVYKVSIAYRGHTVSATPLVVGTTAPAGDISVPFVTVKGFALLSDGSPVPGAAVTVRDATNGTSWSVTASDTGEYTFTPLIAGSYNVTARTAVFASLPQPFVAGSATPTLNLTLAPAGWVAGTTYVFGTPQPFATLSFQSASNSLLVRSVTSDAAGAFNVSLPAGLWNVNGRLYQGSTLYATLARVDVEPGRSTALGATFESGARVNGTILGSGVGAGSPIAVGFLGPTGEWWVRVAGGGTSYMAFLPLGTYSVQGSTPTSAFFGTLNLASSRTMNLPFADATSLSGVAYWDMDGNGRFDSGEGIADARVALVDNLGFRALAVTNATGGFTIVGFANRTYAGTVSADGFVPATIARATLSEIGPNAHIALTVLPVTLTGVVFANGTSLLNHPITIRAEPLDVSARAANATSDPQGSYSLALVPGRYELVVDEDVSGSAAWRYQNLATDSLLLTVAEGQASYDLHLAVRTLVQGNVTLSGVAGPANVTFLGPDARNVTATAAGYRVYLQPGSYSVSASRSAGGLEYGVLQDASLPGSGNLTLSLVQATRVTGQLLLDGAPITFSTAVSLARAEGGSFEVTSTATGSYTAFLVPGNYTVSVNATNSVPTGTFLRFYRYTFTGGFAIAPGLATFGYSLDLVRTLHNTTVAGTVSLAGAGVDASMSFLAQPGGALNASVAVPASGVYSIDLAPGLYQVYATRAVGQSAFLGTLAVSLQDLLVYNVGLQAGHVLSGVTTDDTGARTTAALSVSTQGLKLTLATDASGAYQILLPTGSYTVAATKGVVQNGLAVNYSATAATNLTADVVVNLQLTKDVHRAVTLSWDASQNRTILPGGSVTYTIAVHNAGNVADTFGLLGLTSGWSYTFSPSTVSLNFGDVANTTYVSVSLHAPASALVDHGAITVSATSTADSSVQGTLELSVGIARVRGLSLSLDATSGTFDGKFLNYTVSVTNSGNAPETVSAAVTNPADLAASGWIARLGRVGAAASGPLLEDLVVGANSTTQLRLSLQQSGGASGATVVLQVAAQDNPAVSAQVVAAVNLPMLEPTAGVGVSGPQILRILPANTEILAIVIGAGGAVAVALVLTRKRR